MKKWIQLRTKKEKETVQNSFQTNPPSLAGACSDVWMWKGYLSQTGICGLPLAPAIFFVICVCLIAGILFFRFLVGILLFVLTSCEGQFV